MIAGKDKGKTGKVCASTQRRSRVFVEGMNIVKRHKRPARPGRPNAPVGVIEKEGPIHISNVMLLDPKDTKPTRVGVDRREDGRRIRVTEAIRDGDRLTWRPTEDAIQRRDPPAS